uniref:(northern house mosquito) hypothetical protein n=1 Tax=Culex pipiens TaxID=7175 RepID=A0A8D8GXU1_CULPI
MQHLHRKKGCGGGKLKEERESKITIQNGSLYMMTQRRCLSVTSLTSTESSLASSAVEASSLAGTSVWPSLIVVLDSSGFCSVLSAVSAAGSTSILLSAAAPPEMLAVVVVASAVTTLPTRSSSVSKLRLATGVLAWSRTREKRFFSMVTGLATIPRKPLKSSRVRLGLSVCSLTSSASEVDSGVMALRLRDEPAGVRRLSLWISEPTVTFKLDEESFRSAVGLRYEN